MMLHLFVFIMDYSNNNYWTIFDRNSNIDVFLLLPCTGVTKYENVLFSDKDLYSRWKILINRQISLYKNYNVYIPYYRQMSFDKYFDSDWESNDAIKIAYNDVYEAFNYYLNYYNNDNGIIFSGFSQGAYLLFLLLMDIDINFICSYNFGWVCYEDILQKLNSKNIYLSEHEEDLNCIIPYDCEDFYVNDTFVLPKNKIGYSVNPLTWNTSKEYVTSKFNKGACFINDEGKLETEINNFCGAYLSDRGTIKIVGIDADKYSSENSRSFPYGYYHLHCIDFFYRNIEENMIRRVNKFNQLTT